MRPEDIKAVRDREPFVPFRIVFTDGKSFQIPHRDFLMISRHTLEIGVAREPGSAIPEEIVHASPLHVVRIEQMQAVA